MTTGLRGIGVGFVFLAIPHLAWALTATIEVNEPGWYTAKKATTYNGTELTRFYAPLPVFLEGWKSEPREDIVEYRWNFGDGSPVMPGFNGAHVYENPGRYTATLTVVDKNGGTSTASIQIEALERNGITYYVDSAIGDDTNAGTTPEAPWKTATYAFRGMNVKRYKPGDRILFKRGQTFDMEAGIVSPGHYVPGYGYYFGAYGEGEKPLIKHVGTSNLPLIKIGGMDLAHWALIDLAFDGTTPEGIVSDIFIDTAQAMNLLFLRCELRNFMQGIGLNGKAATGGYVISNVTVKDCLTQGSGNIHLYAKAHRYALLDNHFDLSGNHLAYLAYVDKGVVTGNRFTRAAFGRRGLRISGAEGLANPSNNIYVANNRFEGWVDPVIDNDAHNGGGTRYNWLAVEFGPNTSTDQAMEYAIFENNVITDCETFLKFGNWEHLIVRNNTMTTVSPYGGSARVQFGHEFEQKPLRDIRVLDNIIVSNEKRTGNTPIFHVVAYRYTEYQGRIAHDNLIMKGNRITMVDGDTRMLLAPANPIHRAAIVSNGNVCYGPTDQAIYQVGGTWNAPGELYDLAGWRTFSGEDRATLWFTAPGLPLPGIASSPDTCSGSAIRVTYEGAECTNDSGINNVRLWVRKDDGAWSDTGLVCAGGKGHFDYGHTNGPGTYYFATQAVDNSGAVSPVPTGIGHTQTVFSGTSETAPDTVPPTVGAVTAPALVSSLPVPVQYDGAADVDSGLKEVQLWASKDGGAWADTGLRSATASGSFDYTASTGDGTYRFAVRARDVAGNLSAEPTGVGGASTVLDSTAPSLGALSAPATASIPPLTLTYSGVQDALSGLKSVYLWSRKGTGSWSRTELSASASSGTFAYADIAGNDTYYFALQVEDVAGNVTAVPTGAGMAQTIFQRILVSGTATAPMYRTASPIPVTYSGASDNSGTAPTVRLWYKKGTGAWTDTGSVAFGASGSFPFTQLSGDDTYYFAVQATASGGLATPAPTGSGQDSTIFDTTPPDPGTASAPGKVNKNSITVTYTGVVDAGSGIKQVMLWMKTGRDGVWVDTGQRSTVAPNGTFTVTNLSRDGKYFFFIQAEDKAGLTSSPPIEGSVIARN